MMPAVGAAGPIVCPSLCPVFVGCALFQLESSIVTKFKNNSNDL